VFTVDINELLDYLICPFRHTFNKLDEFDSLFSIKCFINRQLLNHCFLLTMNDQKINTTKLNEKLNYVWNDLKPKLLYHPTLKEKLLLKSRTKNIVEKFSTMEYIMYFDVPKTIEINGITILYSYFTYYQDGYKTLIRVSKNQSYFTSDNSNVKFLTNLVYYDLKNQIKNNQVYLFREDIGDLLERIPVAKNIVYSTLDNVTKGISNKVYYPKSDLISCKSCNHRLVCPWNVSKNE